MRRLIVLACLLLAAPALAEEGDAAPAWLQWLGWSDDGVRFALRAGTADEQRRTGAPIEITRLAVDGSVDDRLRVVTGIREALRARRITPGAMVAREQVTPIDTLLRAAHGQLFAVVVRGDEAAVMRRSPSGRYDVVERWPVRSPATELTAFGWESPRTHRLAIVTSTAPASTAHLSILSLADEVTASGK